MAALDLKFRGFSKTGPRGGQLGAAVAHVVTRRNSRRAVAPNILSHEPGTTVPWESIEHNKPEGNGWGIFIKQKERLPSSYVFEFGIAYLFLAVYLPLLHTIECGIRKQSSVHICPAHK